MEQRGGARNGLADMGITRRTPIRMHLPPARRPRVTRVTGARSTAGHGVC